MPMVLEWQDHCILGECCWNTKEKDCWCTQYLLQQSSEVLTVIIHEKANAAEEHGQLQLRATAQAVVDMI